MEVPTLTSWLANSLSYEEYLARWRENAERPLAGLDKQQRKFVFYARYNHERARQVHEAYEVSAKLREALRDADVPQVWMVLTEDWCVDSAYNLAVIAEAAALSEGVVLRILLRDENPEVMDRYLTNGGRSIPKLVAFTEAGEELFQWGPRPAAGQALREAMLSAGVDKAQVSEALLAWYDAGGWSEVDEELAAALAAVQEPG